MKAMIFAAGLGTRLRPLTHHRPKALVEVGGKCLLEIVIRRLLAHGFEEIVVNVHHFAGQVEAFLAQHAGFGARIAISDERSLLLDTGGGLRQAAWFFDEQPFLVHNVDVLSDIDLTAMYQAHLQSGALATLACRRRQSSRYLLFDEQNHLCGWKNVKSGEVRMSRQVEASQPLAFSGIHVIDPKIFAHLPAKEGAFSIITSYLELARHHPLQAYLHQQDLWLDAGKPEKIALAEKWLPRLLAGCS